MWCHQGVVVHDCQLYINTSTCIAIGSSTHYQLHTRNLTPPHPEHYHAPTHTPCLLACSYHERRLIQKHSRHTTGCPLLRGARTWHTGDTWTSHTAVCTGRGVACRPFGWAPQSCTLAGEPEGTIHISVHTYVYSLANC